MLEGDLCLLEFDPEGSDVCVGTFRLGLFDTRPKVCQYGVEIVKVEMDTSAGAQRSQGRREERNGRFCVCPGFIVFLKLRARSPGLWDTPHRTSRVP